MESFPGGSSAESNERLEADAELVIRMAAYLGGSEAVEITQEDIVRMATNDQLFANAMLAMGSKMGSEPTQTRTYYVYKQMVAQQQLNA